MNGPPNTQRDELEAWWALVSRVMAFLLGAAIIGSQVLVPGGELSLLEFASGLAMMGPAIAASAASIIAAARGGE